MCGQMAWIWIKPLHRLSRMSTNTKLQTFKVNAAAVRAVCTFHKIAKQTAIAMAHYLEVWRRKWRVKVRVAQRTSRWPHNFKLEVRAADSSASNTAEPALLNERSSRVQQHALCV
jgi:hypothetical protein